MKYHVDFAQKFDPSNEARWGSYNTRAEAEMAAQKAREYFARLASRKGYNDPTLATAWVKVVPEDMSPGVPKEPRTAAQPSVRDNRRPEGKVKENRVPQVATVESGKAPVSPVSPTTFGLPVNNRVTSAYGTQRVYKTDDSGKILPKQPAGYPRRESTEYRARGNEKVKPHRGIDFQSRDAQGRPARMDFRAGVHGRVVEPIGGPMGTITVELKDGTRIQYLHTSQQNVRVGQDVAPETILGKTGATGANAIHLHVQARDRNGTFIDPALVLRGAVSTQK